MKRLFTTLTHSLIAIALVLFGLAPTVSAAKPSPTKPSTKVNTLGNDISYPQCGSTLPTDQAFAIIGVNGGLATIPNPCLADQLAWAGTSTGVVASQPKTQLYVNTANPGQVTPKVATWPTNGETPYGTCDGSNSAACSWQYGYDRAVGDVAILEDAAPLANPANYLWWLDVETENSWQAGSVQALENNRATLEGMVAYFTSQGAQVGIYSTNYQWGEIAGTVQSSSSLYTLNSWMAGARSQKGAKENCKNAPLVAGGKVVLSQFVSRGLDYDVSCS